MPDDKVFMSLALGLAKKGLGKTSPNPVVGAVVVKNGKVVGTGYHKKAGLEHAEIRALREAAGKAKDATLYVTLEPCDHFGKTLPCTEAIIKSGVRKVVAAMRDPNPLNNGKGFKRLKKAGIEVVSGVLENDAKKLNEIFIKYITTKKPFVIAKIAQSLDGKIATRTGDSKWISGEESRQYVHRLRGTVDAVMVGANTVIKDDPLLTSRPLKTDYRLQTTDQRQEVKQPVKIVVDSMLKISPMAKIFSKVSPAKVILATTKSAHKDRIRRFKKMGADVLILGVKNGKVDLRQLMKELGRREITSVLVEGGGELIGSLVEENLIDKFLFFISPKIIGGKNAITSVEGRGIKKFSQAPILKDIKYKKFGNDLLIEGYLT